MPDDRRLSFNILITPEGNPLTPAVGFVVVVELTHRPTQPTKAIGKLVKVRGDNMETGLTVDIALQTQDIPYIWPPEIEQQLADLQNRYQSG